MSAFNTRNARGASFLPEDYLRKKGERRSGMITGALFCIVMFGVIAAFFVTNRQKSRVEARQVAINAQYAQEAKKIEQLKVLEAQKAEMLEKAEITTALIEKVPRSILLAEIINRMPEELTLTSFKLVSKRQKEAPTPKAPGRTTPRSLAGKPTTTAAGAKPGAKEPEKEPDNKPKPPRYEFTISLVGLSQSDREVADYHAALKQCPLLKQVDLMFSGEVIIDQVALRKFKIEALIRPDADARQIEPLHVPRLASRPGSPIPPDLQAPGDNVLEKQGLGAGKKGVSSVPENKE
jgi:Tfp pilus assembly protein PilN